MKKDNVYIKRSQIHGKGVFAARNLKKGETVLHWDINHSLSKELFDKLSQREKDYVSLLDGKYIVMQKPEKYVNHSCDPNTETDGSCDIASRDIEENEEITSDYSKALSHGDRIKCNCGSSNCKNKFET